MSLLLALAKMTCLFAGRGKNFSFFSAALNSCLPLLICSLKLNSAAVRQVGSFVQDK